MDQANCCCVKPGEEREVTIRVKLSCTPDEGEGCCAVSAQCCVEDAECCPESTE